jgi:hypothetical protein
VAEALTGPGWRHARAVTARRSLITRWADPPPARRLSFYLYNTLDEVDQAVARGRRHRRRSPHASGTVVSAPQPQAGLRRAHFRVRPARAGGTGPRTAVGAPACHLPGPPWPLTLPPSPGLTRRAPVRRQQARTAAPSGGSSGACSAGSTRSSSHLRDGRPSTNRRDRRRRRAGVHLARLLFVTFFIPSALISAELGAAIPEEGGAYVWVRRAFGRYAGALTSLLYWAGTPMWLGGSVAVVAMAVYQQFLGSLSLGGMYLFGTVFIALATAGAIIPLRFGKWIPTSGAIAQIALLAFFTGSVVSYGARHGVHGISAADLTRPRRSSSRSSGSAVFCSSASSCPPRPRKRWSIPAATSRWRSAGRGSARR